MEIKLPVVLSVDDNDVDGALLQRAFKRTAIPAKLFTVNEGPQALSYLTGEGIYQDREHYPIPDLILLDIRMPKMSGLEVLNWIRLQPNLKQATVLILSSSEQPEDINSAKRIGADGYLVKPTRFEDLQKLVRGLESDWLKKKTKAPARANAKSQPLQPSPTVTVAAPPQPPELVPG
jgi:CheY-like chemotaxis protein